MVDYDPSSSNPLGGPNDVVILGRDEEIGSTWGVSYNSNTGKFYASSALKRHVGFPTNNGLISPANTPGAIYKMEAGDDGNGNRLTAPTLLFDLAAVSNTGTVGAGGTIEDNPTRFLASSTGLQADATAFDLVGKMGIGDIDISPDKRTLYAIALGNGAGGSPQIVRLDVTMENAVSFLDATDITLGSTGIPAGTGAVRPWGLGINQQTGQVYVGVVTEGNGQGMPGRGYVLEFDETAGTFSQAFNFNFDYPRTNTGTASSCPATWNGWTSTYPDIVAYCGSDPYYDLYGQPIISDIEVLSNGSFVIGVMDRWGMQTGSSQQKTDGSPGSAIWGASAERGRPVGDVLSFPAGTSGAVPANNSPNYSDNASALEDKAALGGLAVQPGGTQILVPAVDPDGANSNGLTAINLSSGFRIDNQDLITGNGTGVAEKGIALGDVEIGIANPVNECTVSGVQANNLGCDGNAYSVEVTISYMNAPVGNTFTIISVGGNITTPVLEGSGVYTDTLTGQTDITPGLTIAAVSNIDNACSAVSNPYDGLDCMAGQCTYNNDGNITGTCTYDEAFGQNNFSGTVTASFTNGSSTYSLYFESPAGSGNYLLADTGPSDEPLTFSGSSGSNNTFVNEYYVVDGNPGGTISDPLPCNSGPLSISIESCPVAAACTIDVTGLSGTPTCQADGTYTIDVLVDYADSPGGLIQIGVTAGNVGYSGTLATTAGSSMTGAVVTIEGLPANGDTNLDLFGSFLEQPDCEEVQNVTFTDPACPQPSCPPALDAPTVTGACNDNGTNANADDDFIAVTFSANTGGRGDYEILVDGNPLMPSIQAANGQTVIFNLPASVGGSAGISYRLVFDPLSSCTPPAPIAIALDPCPTEAPCDLMFSGMLVEGDCETVTGGDDLTTYTIPASTVSAVTGGQAYDVLVNGTPTVSAVPFAQAASFTLPSDGRIQFVTIRQTDRTECTVELGPIAALEPCVDEDGQGGDCNLVFSNVSPDCSFNAASGVYTFTVSFELEVTTMESEAIEVTFDGTPIAASPLTSSAGNTDVYILSVQATEPAFDVVLQASATDPNLNCSAAVLVDLIACTPACDNNADEVGGNVFLDGNNDGADAGAMEVGQSNVLVRVYDCSEMLVCEVYTDENGDWSCDNAMAGDTFRVEYTTPLSPELQESFAGTNNGTSTQFVIGGTCNADYGVVNAETFCQSNPTVVLTCYAEGERTGVNAADAALILFPYDVNGHDFVGTNMTAAYQGESILTHGQIGSTYGLAFQRNAQSVYVAAYHKRYSDFGPAGPDAIYQVATDGTLLGTIELDNLTGTTNSAGADVHDFSIFAFGEALDLGPNNEVFDGVGKISFGDIDIDEVNGVLYAVNMFDRNIYAIDVSTGDPAQATLINTIAAPDGTGTGNHRPMALKFKNNVLYVGSVNENSQEAFLHAIIPATGTVSELARLDMTYDRQAAVSYDPDDVLTSAEWRPWDDNPEDDSETIVDFDEILNPQPMFSDIEIDGEDFIFGFRDRHGDQTGAGTFYSRAEANNNLLTYVVSAGDIIKACTVNGTVALEGQAGCPTIGGRGNSGINGTEFYHWDIFHDPDFAAVSDWSPNVNEGGLHWETALGSLLQINGQPSVMATVYDPFNDYSAGVLRFDNVTGRREGNNSDVVAPANLTGGYTIFDTGDFDQSSPDDNATFGKGNGLGDLEGICDQATVQIGNYAWVDTDADGLQDPCEPPLAGLTVKLYRKIDTGVDPVLIATDVTDATGNYYFSSASAAANDPDQTWIGTGVDTSVANDLEYFVAFCGDNGFDTGNNSLMVNGLTLCPSPANMGQVAASNPADGSADQSDSDVTVQDVAGTMIPAYCTEIGELADGTNHTFDAGFKPLECEVSINDLEITCNNGDDFIFSFQVQYANSFPANTMIEVFLDGDPVTGSPFTATDASGMFDVEAIAVDDPAFNVPLVVRFIGNTNNCDDVQLLDFIACTPTCDDQPGANIVGGSAFVDVNNDGTNDNETGQSNVLVRVYDCAEMLVCEVYTDENGDWSCDNAMAGDTFRVEYTTPLSPYLSESFAGPNNGTSTQFIIGGTCAADYGVFDETEFCNTQTLSMAVSCYESGDGTGSNANNPAFISFSNDDSGTTPDPQKDAEISQLGSTWGTAHVPESNTVFTGTVLKRHVAIADGLGYLYQLDYSDIDNPSFVQGINLEGLIANNTGQAISFGSICRSPACANQGGNTGIANDYVLPTDPTDPSFDLDAFAKVGKVGIGDVDYDVITEKIWLINTNERTLISMDLSGALPGDINSFSIIGASGVPTCTGGEIRPWGLEFYHGKGYLGVVCDASVSQSANDLTGFVLQFDPQDLNAGFTVVKEIDFEEAARDDIRTPDSRRYAREAFGPWVNTLSDLPQEYRDHLNASNSNQSFTFRLPTPIISDIEFDQSGNMYVGILDRSSMQFGFLQGAPVSGADGLINLLSAGDLFKYCVDDAGRFTKEGELGCMPTSFNGDDFFNLRSGDGAYDAPIGSMVVLSTTDEIVMTVIDPFPPGANPNFSLYQNTQGIHWNSLTTGDRTDWYRIVDFSGGDQRRTQGKGTGLGDLVALCDAPLVQIGNYAWLDSDADGLQDPCEPPLAGLAVKLYRKNSDDPTAPILIATDTTDATGNYYFSSAGGATGDAMQNWIGTDADTTINRDSLYFIAFCGESGFDTGTNSLVVDGVSLCPSPANMGQQAASNATDGSADQNDSDITVQSVDGVMIPAYCTTAGELANGTNHTFDAGFKPLEFDLALRKTLSPLNTQNSFRPGDVVIFDIEVVNQGDVTAFDIVVGDSIPTGMTYNAANSSASGTGVLTSADGVVIDFVNDYLAANDGSFTVDSLGVMDSVTFQVAVTIDAIGTSQMARPLINYAEIQSADNDEDPANTPPEDVDSTPNDNFGDDPGGDPDSPADDFVDGNGMGMPGDTIASTDEDDADPALVPIYDLALTKIIDPASISATASYAQGDLIVFNLNVANQGTDTIGGFSVTDYLPCGYTFNMASTSNGADNTGWSQTGMQLTFTTTDDLLPNGGTQVQLVLTYEDDLCGGATAVDTAFINRAEISMMTNTDGDPVDDFDSVPDDNGGNDPGGQVDSPSDNEVDGNGTGMVGDDNDATDEDDSDPASLNVFDLAIFKVVDSTDAANVGPYVFGDVVKYQIGVVEQGNLPATDVTIKDIIPPGLRFDPSLGLNATAQGGDTWTDNGDGTVSLDVDDFSALNTAGTSTLGGGDTALVCIWLEVIVPNGAIDDNSFVNYAGIEEATFDDPQNPGTPVTVTGDGDSDYDLEVGDDTGDGVNTPDDNETTANRPGEDIDSQDPAFIEVLLGVAVGDTTFIDGNGNGLQDLGDEALPGVTVTVYDATTMLPVTTDIFGQPYANTRETNAMGAYLFDSLPSGNYYVEFDISTAPNGDLYDFTMPNVGGNAGASDGLDSDVVPAAPTDDVGNSDETGIIPPGDTVLTLDAGVVCAIMVDVAEPSTICSTQPVDLTQGAAITPDRLGGYWTTTGTGTFFDAAGTELTVNPLTGGYAFGTAVRYEPSAADASAGEVSFTLTTNDPANLAPASSCAPQAASVTITILQVDCGNFFWEGGN